MHTNTHTGITSSIHVYMPYSRTARTSCTCRIHKTRHTHSQIRKRRKLHTRTLSGYMGPMLLLEIVSHCDQGEDHTTPPFWPEYARARTPCMRAYSSRSNSRTCMHVRFRYYGYVLAGSLLVTQVRARSPTMSIRMPM